MSRRAAPGHVSSVLAAALCTCLGVPSLALGAPSVPEGSLALRAPKQRDPLVVAIVDDAFRLDHATLRELWLRHADEVPQNGVDDDGNGRVDDVLGWDVADGDADVSPPADRVSEFAHGTHLAGVVANGLRDAFGDDTPQLVRLLPVKAMADATERPSLAPGYDGVAYALDRGADVILCAWSVGALDTHQRAILDRAQAEGVLVIGSSGNLGNDTPMFPAAHPGVLSVTAVDDAGARLPLASWGGTIDLAASGADVPGADVRSSDGLVSLSGTSQAAARATTAAAVLWRLHPSWSASEVRAALVGSAETMRYADPRIGAGMGAGRLVVDPDADPWAHRALQSHVVGALPLTRGAREPVSFSLAPPGEVSAVRLQLEVFESRGKALEQAGLTIHGGRSASDPVVFEGSLAELPPNLTLEGRRFYVRFTPPKQGLRALLHYRAQPVDVSARWCSGTTELTEPGVIEDGSGDAAYAPGSDCRWLVRAPRDHVVRFHVEDLDTEPGVDQVLFFHGESTAGSMMAGLSGTEAPESFDSWAHIALVWFVTNVGDERGGWRLRYTFEPAPLRDAPED